MAKMRAANAYSEAEDRSLRLGFCLMGCGLAALLVLGFCWLGPALRELRGQAANCTVRAVRQAPGESFPCTFRCGPGCGGTARYPCLQVYVTHARSRAPALLHQDEAQLLRNPKCSYIPPCERDNQKNSESVLHHQKYWREDVGSQPFVCYFNQHQRPDDVLLRHTHDWSVLLHCCLWPLLVFLVGGLIVLLTVCAKNLAVRAEAIKKRKYS
ncbi:calcium-activated potassium channel subunit beta-4 [Rhinatrema bivittatum]|uniref:calcium-activated potassium channel subunit beta-4 n=1 Tax=Rhinatrema bivittatum TaxID=194408 RepID=UPI00112E9E1C|nr:calcium-activated potassium channel subunit beta-4 [Rhinatrema bivittatum]